MKLNRLSIKNFKGISSFEIAPAGKSLSIYGDNASGKTTLFDSFTWLLFGKDSLNSAQFEIKPIGGQRGVETQVEAELDLDSHTISLRKVYSEKWTKRRGSAQAEFSGHNIDHWVDGVPVKKNEFDKAVAGICDQGLFKTLSNPRHVNEVLTWQERRGMLMGMFGDLPDEAVITSDARLEELPGIVGKHSLDDYRKISKARMPEINRELAKIPVRIDEVQATLTEKPRDLKTVQGILSHLQADRAKKQAELSQIESGGAVADLTKRLREAEAELIKHRNGIEKQRSEFQIAKDFELRNLTKQSEKLADELAHRKSALDNAHTLNAQDADRIDGLKDEIERLRAQWVEENAKQLDVVAYGVCPACGQDLPEDKLQAAHTASLEQLNERKAKVLASISNDGKQCAATIKTIEAQIEARKRGNTRATEEIMATESALCAVNTMVERCKATQYETPQPDVDKDNQILTTINDLETSIQASKEGMDSLLIAQIKAQISDLEAELDTLQREIIAIENSATAKARIEQLKAEERKLADEYERLEYELSIADRFIRTKMSMLEDQINDHFQIDKFKLFDVQINGGVQDCCECMVGGVPYNSLNNAARINAGIDIINTLSAHYGISMPMFCDNAEAVTHLMESQSQQIKLIVSEQDKSLRVEEN